MILDPSTVPGGYSFARLRRFIAGRLPGIPPLRQRSVRLAMGLARPAWVDSDIDVRDHVFKHVRRGATLSDVAAYAATFAAAPLDRTRPLWTIHVIEGLQDGTVAIVAKVHHSLMDGVAGMDFLASMFSLRPEANPVVAVGADIRRASNPATRLALALPELFTVPLRASRALVETGRAGRHLAALARQGTLSVPRPPRMRWNGELGPRRVVALASIPLAEIKDVAHATNTTVNDVVLSVLGGACRTYLDKRNELPDTSLVAIVPVSTHEMESGGQNLANALSLTLSIIGTNIPDPVERLAAVHEAMVAAKRLHDALGPDVLTDWLAVANPLLLSAAAHAYLGLRLARYAPVAANVLISDVPGPPVPLYFGGARLLGLFPLGPVYDGVGVNVTVVSCENSLGFGLVSSPELVDDIDALARGVGEELSALRLSVRAGRPEGPGSPARPRPG